MGWTIESTQKKPKTLNNCTLIIPSYRRPQSVILLLQQLMVLEDVPSEVIIVDGSPESNVEGQILEWITRKRISFKLIYIHSPSGLTRQRNIGIEASSGDIIFFLDDDCIPQDGYFREIDRVFKEDKDSKVGGVAGSIINEMNHPLTFRWRLRMFLHLVPRNGIPGKYYSNATSVPRGLTLPFIEDRETEILPGGASAYRKEVFDDQRFSEFFQGYAQGEDLEMSLRIGKRWKLFWCGRAHALHLHTPLGRPHAYKKGEMEVRNRYFIWKRHTPDLTMNDKIKFWGDISLIAFLDLGKFVIRPWRIQPLIHGVGVLSGIFGCLFSPPNYQEPTLKPTYSFQFKDIPVSAQPIHE